MMNLEDKSAWLLRKYEKVQEQKIDVGCANETRLGRQELQSRAKDELLQKENEIERLKISHALVLANMYDVVK